LERKRNKIEGRERGLKRRKLKGIIYKEGNWIEEKDGKKNSI
jgi:hypothetical protein